MEKTTQNLVKRHLTSSILQHLEKQEITIIIGPRQVGKTTLLKQLQERLISKGLKENNVLYFNLDILTELELFSEQSRFIKFLKERVGKEKLFVFIDEAQRVKNAGIFFKGIYDLNLPVKFVLTGSSALEIKAKIHESLTGRKRIFHLYPFSFSEYLSKHDLTLEKISKQEEISDYDQKQIMEHLFSFAVWGGYPKVAIETNIEEKQELLKEIFSSYLEKDIVGFLKIKNYSTFCNLITLLSAQIGQLLNTNTLGKSLKTGRKTLDKYLEIIEKTFVAQPISPFFRNHRKEITKMPKIYFLDTGLRNFALKTFQDFETRPDKGSLLENFVFSEIIKQTDNQLHFWRTKEKAEVDFILADYMGNIIPLEIKASALRTPELSRGLQGFISSYQPKQTFIINLGFQGKTQINKTMVNFIYPYEIERIISSQVKKPKP